MDKPHTIQKILIRSPNHIGDSVMALPTYQAIRQAFPKAKIVILSSSATAELSGLYQLFDEVWTLKNRSSSELLKVAFKARQRKFDLGISFPASLSSGLLFYLCGIRYRVGFAGIGGQVFYHQKILWKGRSSQKHKSQMYQEILSLLKIEAANPKVTASPTVLTMKQSSYFVVAPGASIELRQWPHTVEFIKALRQKYPDKEIHVLGARSDSVWSERVEALGDSKVIDKIGKTSIADVIEYCRGAEQVFAMDSGIAHLSATLAMRPTTVIFGPGDPKYIQPQGSVAVVRLEDLQCSPCENSRCAKKYGYKTCLANLTVEKVLKTIRSDL